MKDKIPKILVERNQDAAFSLGPGEDCDIRTPWGSLPNPQNIVASPTQLVNTNLRDVFVCAEPHGSSKRCENFLFAHTSLRVRSAGAELLFCDVIIGENILLAPTVSDQP